MTKTNQRRSAAAGAIFAALVLAGQPVSAAGIKKCQDAEGNWHYGDFAAQECGKAEVTSISGKSGVVTGKEAPPPTQEELDAKQRKKKENEAQAKARKKQREQDQSVVRIYGSEETILATRDRKIEAIDNNIQVTSQLKSSIQSDIEELQGRKQTDKVKKMIKERERAIDSYDSVLEQARSERAKLEDKYNEILREFRDASQRLASGG